ncbi:MAG: phosphoserine phosphatase SerB [Pseudomonadota bacterium]
MSNPHIVTLIAEAQKPLLGEALAEKVASTVNGTSIKTLSPNRAYEFTTEHTIVPAQIIDIIDKKHPIDIAVQPLTGTRRKRLLLADMDSTMIRQECIDELAAEVGVKDRVSEITARAMNGEIEFEAALRERVALLKGLPTSVIETVIANRIQLMPGGTALVKTMRANGAYCALVSGGFTDFTSRIAEIIGFDEHRANRLLHADQHLTGEVAEPILGKQAKLDTMNDLCERLNLTHDDVVAVGDGANDLAMITAAGLGVALHAKPSVASQADVKIDHGDLTSLLYLQGYTDDEIVN